MYIKNIKLYNFRNYEEEDINLSNNINVFYGDNAQGKTNILESIFICSMGKSYRTKKEEELIKFNKENSKVEIFYQKKDRQGIIKVEINNKNKKEIFINGIKIKKLSEILGNLNIVLFSPDDMEILKDGPQKRRKFINILISQLRPVYLYNLNMYLKILEQRNNYLKQINFQKKPEELLDIWDEKLAQHGEVIFKYRKEFFDKIKDKIKEIHYKITEKKEEIDLEYYSDFKDKSNFLKILKNYRKSDIIRGYTQKGIHRDDFYIKINNKELNIYGSQGQYRTSILSLKLSELYVIYDELGEYPILLLDDFMSELDEKRRINFIKNITEAQVLITGTHKLVLDNFKYNMYNVKDGKVNENKI